MYTTPLSRVSSLPVYFSIVTHRSQQALVLTEHYRLGDILRASIINQAGQQARSIDYAFCRPTTLYLVASRFQGQYYLVEYSEDLHIPMCSCRERAYGWCSHCQKIADLIGLLV